MPPDKPIQADAPKKPGRPKEDDAMRNTITFRHDDDGLSKYERAARRAKMPLATWMRERLDVVADRELSR